MDSYQSINVGSDYRISELNIHRKRMNQIMERKNQFIFQDFKKSPQYVKKKTTSMDLEKNYYIDNENRILLNKLINISKRQMTENNQELYKKKEKMTLTEKLNKISITRENVILFKKLVETKPFFENKKLNEEYNLHQQVIKMHKKVRNNEETSALNHSRANTLGNNEYLFPKLIKINYKNLDTSQNLNTSTKMHTEKNK